MLAIKHVAANGVETILEAGRIRVVRNQGMGNDGIFLDPDDGNGLAVIDGYRPKGRVSGNLAQSDQLGPSGAISEEMVPDTFRHVIHFAQACSSSDTHQPTVYVMNRFGATVATYRL